MNSVTFETEIAQAVPVTVPAHRAYLPSADLMDVMIEQMEYLVRHGSECHAGCTDCVRMARMKACLLQPFGGFEVNWCAELS